MICVWDVSVMTADIILKLVLLKYGDLCQPVVGNEQNGSRPMKSVVQLVMHENRGTIQYTSPARLFYFYEMCDVGFCSHILICHKTKYNAAADDWTWMALSRVFTSAMVQQSSYLSLSTNCSNSWHSPFCCPTWPHSNWKLDFYKSLGSRLWS